jgi:hypothetical protein
MVDSSSEKRCSGPLLKWKGTQWNAYLLLAVGCKEVSVSIASNAPVRKTTVTGTDILFASCFVLYLLIIAFHSP